MNNKLLKIDLSRETIGSEELSDEILNQYLGGRGLGVKFVDPLAPENLLVFAVGPLTGTIVPTSGRFSLVTKSPLTNTIMHSNSGGIWGTVLKKCGYDALYVTGRLEGVPGYILRDGADVELKRAEDLWSREDPRT